MSRSPRALRLVVLAVVAASVAWGCSSDDGLDPGEARLRVDGSSEVARAGGDKEVVDSDTTLQFGDRFTVVDGTAVLELPGGSTVEGRAPDGGDPTSVAFGQQLGLEQGSALVTAASTVDITAAGTVVEVSDGAARLQVGLGVVVASYDADVQVDSAGVQRSVIPLRQVAIPSRGLPGGITPLNYDAGDSWDVRLLGDAIRLGEELQASAVGYTANLRPGSGRTVGFYRTVVPGLADQEGFTADLLDLSRPPGELMVGAVISVLGVQGSFPDRWSAVFGFRSEGAEWGLVALDQGVERAPILDRVDEVIAASDFIFSAEGDIAAGPGPATGGPVTTTTTTVPGTAPPPTTTTTTTVPPPTTTTTTTAPPLIPEPTLPDVGDLLLGDDGDDSENLEDVVDAVVDALLGG